MKKPPLDVQAAARVAQVVILNDVQCLSLSASFVQEREAPPGWSLSWRLAPIAALWQRIGHEVIAIFPFTIHIDAKGESEPIEAIRTADVQVCLRLHYAPKQGSELSESDLDDFVGVNGYIHAWPYLRAEVQALTTKIGLPPLLLPLQLAWNASQTVTVAHASEMPVAGASGA